MTDPLMPPDDEVSLGILAMWVGFGDWGEDCGLLYVLLEAIASEILFSEPLTKSENHNIGSRESYRFADKETCFTREVTKWDIGHAALSLILS